MKQTAINEWKDGLNLDLHPLVTPKTVLTDNINGTFITYNGNEFCLQNDRGNKEVAKLTTGYTPIGIKEHNGILYIVSVNGDKTEIGTFPSLQNTTSLNDIDFYVDELDIELDYKPLKIGEGHSDFTNVDLGYSVITPITIEIQDSYDGSVNLILVADGKPTKIINSGFSKLSDKKGKWIKRNQKADTNIYHLTDSVKLNQELNLIRTNAKITNIDLLGVQSGGQFKGGNYTFYIKFGDADYNQTDVAAESGIVSIFNGNDGVPSTISGTLADERTDKMINLRIIGLNDVYSKIYIYYSREYSDTQGYRMTEYGMFSEPIDLKPDIDIVNGDIIERDYQSIWLTGFEQTTPIEPELLNVDYHTVDWSRAEAQHSNMLFLGNVGQEKTFELYDRLKDFSKRVEISRDSDENRPELPMLDMDYSVSPNSNNDHAEYYNTQNIYKRVGYYPGELYRFGIVYILKDGSKTPVFNVKGNVGDKYEGVYKINGPKVFTTVTEENNKRNVLKPIYLKFTVPEITEQNVIGWFIVRQKRIPNTICEGLSIAIDKTSNIPVIYDGNNWITQSFLNVDRDRTYEDNDDVSVKLKYNNYNLLDGEFDQDKFNEWLNEKGYEISPYWVFSNRSDSEYSCDESIDWVGNTYNQLEQGIENLVSKYMSSNPSHQNRRYEIFVDSTTNGSPEEETIAEELLSNLKNGATFPLYWYRKYTVDDIPSENEYIVGITNSLHDFARISVESEGRNQNLKNQYIASLESRKLTNKILKEVDKTIWWREANALLSLDPCVNQSVASILDGSKFYINLERTAKVNTQDDLIYKYETDSNRNDFDYYTERCTFINSNTGVKVIDGYEFSNVAGISSDVSKFKYFTFPGIKFKDDLKNTYNTVISDLRNYNSAKDEEIKEGLQKLYRSNQNVNLIRGLFTPYIGITNNDGRICGIWSIKHKQSLGDNDYTVRAQDNSEYYCVSEYKEKSNIEETINVYRGDCYTNTVTMRIIRNFIDDVAPVADVIVNENGWKDWVFDKEQDSTGEDRVRYDQVNVSDVNTVDLGLWATFKCLSSYNLGLRSKDTFHTDEMALLGSPRSFYPLNSASTATGNKMEESFLLNDGLSATVGRKRYNLMPDVPYSKSEFSNRIMFSNVNVTDAFTNGYRTFQGMSYKDYDKQYGAITKLLSLGQNIFVVMEHGLGLVPVNPKALMQTTTGEAIHIYGYGVLPDEMTIVSQDYGSKYEHSVIRTPIGIYGIDADAKKIWRFSDKQGFETISDMKIETYLKDNLKPLTVEIGKTDIRTHYNGKKGDLMFTWNDKDGNLLFSICYNERQNLWTTKYDWKPIVSENINDEFYSLNKYIKNRDDSDCYIWEHSDDVGYGVEEHVSNWYNGEQGFEFEFVVSDPVGVNKVFDNIQIISNNVQPNEMEITVIGDDYEFKRDCFDQSNPLDQARANRLEVQTSDSTDIRTTSNIHGDEVTDPTGYKQPENSGQNPRFWTYKFDKRLNQSALTKWQPFKDIYKFGRRIGNIQYKEGSWFAQIEPLLINSRKEARIRDKWAKIRIRYSGKDLAVITAIKTLINI